MESAEFIKQLGGALTWIGGGVLALLAALGGGSLVIKLFERKWTTRDKAVDIHETNTGKQIDAEIVFRQSFIDRLTKVEARLEQVQTDLQTQLVMNAKLEAENLNLKDGRARDKQEIKELHDENNKQAVKIINLESEVRRLQTDVDGYTKQLAEVNAKLDILNKSI